MTCSEIDQRHLFILSDLMLLENQDKNINMSLLVKENILHIFSSIIINLVFIKSNELLVQTLLVQISINLEVLSLVLNSE